MKDLTILHDFKSPVDHYPDKKLGCAEIKHTKKGTKGTYFGEGVRGMTFYRFAKTVQIVSLKINQKVWMTSDCTYTFSLESFAERSSGRVLVAGLGLGIVVHQLVKNPAVTEIIVVDREQDVIDLVGPLLPKDARIKIVHEDFDLFTDRMSMQDWSPDTILWDLAVWSSRKEQLANQNRVCFQRVILGAKFMPMYWDGKAWQKRTSHNPKLKIFIHGLDRDPVGEKFVKTKGFQQVREAINV